MPHDRAARPGGLAPPAYCTNGAVIRECARLRWPLTPAWLRQAAQRLDVPLYIAATPAAILSTRAALKDAERTGCLGRADPADIARRSLERNG